MKPGWKTSEFWLLLIGVVLLIALTELKFHWFEACAPLLGFAAYAHGRGIAKNGSGSRPFVFSTDSLTRYCPDKRASTRPRSRLSIAGERATAARSAATS